MLLRTSNKFQNRLFIEKEKKMNLSKDPSGWSLEFWACKVKTSKNFIKLQKIESNVKHLPGFKENERISKNAMYVSQRISMNSKAFHRINLWDVEDFEGFQEIFKYMYGIFSKF